jgi:quinoprotein glucose dehydrogenase
LLAQNDWPSYGHDPGGQRYSPLKIINPKNVSQLKLAWTLDMKAPVPASNRPRANNIGERGAK